MRFLVLGLLALALLPASVHSAMAAYVATVDLAVDASPQFLAKSPMCSARRADASLNSVGLALTSEGTLQSAARQLMLFNISLDPAMLLSTIKVEPVPGEQAVRVEVTSENRNEAEAGADAVATEGQRVYFLTANPPDTSQKDKTALRLKRLGSVTVSQAPSVRTLHLAFAGVGVIALIALVLMGFLSGRLSYGRQTRALLGRLFIAVAAIALVASVSGLVKLKATPPQYVGRVKMRQRLGPHSELQSRPMKLIDSWVGRPVDRRIAKRASATLRLFNISLSPESLLRNASIERIPDTQVLKIEVPSSDRDEAEAATDVVAVELAVAYRASMNPPGTPKSEESTLKFVEEAHVFPVRPTALWTVEGIAAASLVFLLAAAGGIVGKRRGESQAT